MPLIHEVLWPTGDLLLRAEVDLHLRDSAANWQQETFRVDNGSDISAMPAWRAKGLGLPMPQAGIITQMTFVIVINPTPTMPMRTMCVS
jgi:hypothetical protein